MKYIMISCTLLILSCSEQEEKRAKEAVKYEIKREEIIGTWKLYRQSYRPNEETSVVEENEYLEIKNDGSYSGGRHRPGIWFLSFDRGNPIDSASHNIFNEVTDNRPNVNGEYNREFKCFHIDRYVQNGKTFLKLISLNTSGTRIYIPVETEN